MKNLIILFIFLFNNNLYSQEIEIPAPPNYGLALTGTGMTLCVIGTTMSQSPQLQYNGQYGVNYVSYNSSDNRTMRLSTMAVGALITFTGILIQNKNKKKSRRYEI